MRILLSQVHLHNPERALAAAELRRALAIAEELGDTDAAAHIHGLLDQAEAP